MFNYQAIALRRAEVQTIVKFLGLALPAVFLPFYIHNQLVTGPIVNALLILTLLLVGFRAALTVALLPSLVALSSGLLPAVLAPAVPFIMISNVILIMTVDYFGRLRVFSAFQQRAYFFGVVCGALLKFAFLYSSVILIARLLTNQSLLGAVVKMMGAAQLATALAGGLFAWLVLRSLKYFSRV